MDKEQLFQEFCEALNTPTTDSLLEAAHPYTFDEETANQITEYVSRLEEKFNKELKRLFRHHYFDYQKQPNANFVDIEYTRSYSPLGKKFRAAEDDASVPDYEFNNINRQFEKFEDAYGSEVRKRLMQRLIHLSKIIETFTDTKTDVPDEVNDFD